MGTIMTRWLLLFTLTLAAAAAEGADETSPRRLPSASNAAAPSAAVQRPIDNCRADRECVSIVTVSPSCRHVDSKAATVCPGVDGKLAAEYGRINCAVSNPCRAAAGYRCRGGSCFAQE